MNAKNWGYSIKRLISSLANIKVLEELCKELKKKGLQSFNRAKKSKDAKKGGGS